MSGMVHEFDDLVALDEPQAGMDFIVVDNVSPGEDVKHEYDLFEIDAGDDNASLIEYVEEDDKELLHSDINHESADNYIVNETAREHVDDGGDSNALVETLRKHKLLMRQQVSVEGVLDNVYHCLGCDADFATAEEFSRIHYEMVEEFIAVESDPLDEQPWELVKEMVEDTSNHHQLINAADTSNSEFVQTIMDNVAAEHEATSDDDELIKKEPSAQFDSDDGADKYFCCDCQVVFNDLESAEEHTCSTTTSNKATPNEAELIKRHENNLSLFAKIQHNGRFKYQQTPKLTTKASATKFVTYNCIECEKTFTSIHALNSHSRSHKTMPKEPEFPEAPVCPICKTCFDSQKNLKLHMKIHGKKQLRSIEEALPAGAKSLYHEMNKFFCEICNKSFEQNLLGIHKNMHQQYMEEYNCRICNRHFENQLSYDMHMQMHADKSTNSYKTTKPSTGDSNIGAGKAKRFPCQYCERTFTRPFEKVRHERVHTGEKPHACEVCGKTFRVSYSLTLHLRTHTDIRPYVCPTCNKRFKSQPVYTHHLRLHQQERSYKCEQCQKAFRTSVQLSAHRKIHSKPYNCPICNRPFASLYSVKIHMKTHNKLNKSCDDMKHSCWLCGANYARVSALRYHMREMHAVDMVSNEELELQRSSIEIKEEDVDDEAAVLIAAATEADCAAYMETPSATATTQMRTPNTDEVFQVMLQNDEIIYNYETEEIVAD